MGVVPNCASQLTSCILHLEFVSQGTQPKLLNNSTQSLQWPEEPACSVCIQVIATVTWELGIKY